MKTRLEIDEALEANLASARIAELHYDPVQGDFDVAHLKQINFRIFQDFPTYKLNHVSPGDFRLPVAEGDDWIKERTLSIQAPPLVVAYSRMDGSAIQRLETALEGADPEELRHLNTKEFTSRLGNLYAEVDYIHPFRDGNSRTLREFFRQLAEESGFELDWERFGKTDGARDVLYIARDISVNELAKSQVKNFSTLQAITLTNDTWTNARPLPDLLVDAIRPSRAVAFERMAEKAALERFPELEAAYRTIREASSFAASSVPGNQAFHEAATHKVKQVVQSELDAGLTHGFGKSFEPNVKHETSPAKELADRGSRGADLER